jgi:hypothetical protein
MLRAFVLAFIAVGCAPSAPPPAVAPAPATPFSLAGAKTPLVLIPVKIGDAGPFTFILDTGASMTVLTTKTADAIHLARGGDATATGSGGVKSASISVVDQLSVGATHVEHLSVAITDVPHVEKAIGRSIDGILGYNFFRDHCVQLDYSRSEVRFLKQCT